jgi:hypothetical protein
MRPLGQSLGHNALRAKSSRNCNTLRGSLAEGVGFEPTIRFPVYTLSKRAPSATRPPLRSLLGHSDGRLHLSHNVRRAALWGVLSPQAIAGKGKGNSKQKDATECASGAMCFCI